jgi:hypothetical protein
MKIENVVIEKRMYIAEDGTEFYSQRECEEYEKSLVPFVVKPEWIERHKKQVAENEKVKTIVLEFMTKGEKYILTDMYLELLPQLEFLRKRMTVQRLMQITRQMVCDNLLSREEEHRQMYFIKN